MAIIAVMSMMFFCYFNWRVAGSPFSVPYMANEKDYVSTPTLAWQKLRPPIHFQNPQFTAFYNGWMRDVWLQGRSDSLAHTVDHLLRNIKKCVYFYLWPEFCIPLLTLPWVVRDRRIRFLLLQGAFCFVAFLSAAWFQPHYAAPLVATGFAVLVQSLRHLRRWEYKGQPVGIGLSRAVALFAVVLSPFHPHAVALGHVTPSGIEYRAKFEAKLTSTADKHLVIVRYFPTHDVLAEWVYNRADIDDAKVVWAREIPGVDTCPLLNYFRDRKVWLVEPDTSPPHITPYSESTCPTSAH
jgi:hypothetical protein